MDDGVKFDMSAGIKVSTINAANKRLLENITRGKEGDPKKVAQEFESFMIFNLMKELGKTVSLTKKGCVEDTYMTIVYEKLGDFLSRKGIGLKEMLIKHLEEKKAKVSGEKGDNIIE
ncbi:MAG: hypothetical protein N2745_09050 [Syntrophorhabdaceae bacterium]|nr:hypothetical protein [Syntrophorhabdaceae bacterium]